MDYTATALGMEQLYGGARIADSVWNYACKNHSIFMLRATFPVIFVDPAYRPFICFEIGRQVIIGDLEGGLAQRCCEIRNNE